MSRPRTSLTLRVLPTRLAVCRREPEAPLPAWLQRAALWSVTRTSEELSLVVPDDLAPDGWSPERGYRALAVAGPLDFALVGILADLAGVLAAAEISIFAISTYDTDLILVRERDLENAVEALEGAGHEVLR